MNQSKGKSKSNTGKALNKHQVLLLLLLIQVQKSGQRHGLAKEEPTLKTLRACLYALEEDENSRQIHDKL